MNNGIALVWVMLTGLFCATRVLAAGDYVLATASTGGTYYPVGVALSTLVKVKLRPANKINLTAINSAGSSENVRLLREKEADFALMQGLYGSYAWNGSGPLQQAGPQRNLRSVTMLWQDVEHFLVTSEHVRSGTIGDALALKGVAGFGKRDSGSLGSSRALFANLGVAIDEHYNLIYGGYATLAGAMLDGKADLIGLSAGVPVSAAANLMAARGDGVRLLSFRADQAMKADAGMNLWSPYVIPAGTYPGQNDDIHTIAQPNFLAVRADLPEEDVYLITKTIFENLGFLQSIHKATGDMGLEKAVSGLPVPLHPGSARYFREAGVKIPARLVVQ